MNDQNKKSLSVLKKIRQLLIKGLELCLSIAVAFLVFDVIWGVLSRKLLGSQSSWTEELARVLLIWVVLLGAAVAYNSKAHLGLDYLVTKMDQSTKRYVAIIGDAIVLFFTCAVLLTGGFRLVTEAFQLEQVLMALSISKGYVYLALPVSGVFFLMVGLESLYANIFNRRGITELAEEADSAPQQVEAVEIGRDAVTAND